MTEKEFINIHIQDLKWHLINNQLKEAIEHSKALIINKAKLVTESKINDCLYEQSKLFI
ncbi:MAG: hypothetical protein KGJ90_07380 [Patescibacteria group bacterium]|nr:hypothetical protein [Patescibacteria group bacterium]